MSWSFSGGKPIYAQLVEQIQIRIVTGGYPPGARIPTVRELAQEAAVNPNTMQRALSELESSGLVYSQRTSGRYVTEDAKRISALRETLAKETIARFLTEMGKLGFDRNQTCELLSKEGTA